MSASTSGAIYLAKEQQSLTEETPVSLPILSATVQATAPLCEFAAAHDGQPAADWLRVFKKFWQ